LFLGAARSKIPAWPAARQSFSRELQAGGNSICLCLCLTAWSALITPQRATLEGIRTLS
jgi:hypothetical protein